VSISSTTIKKLWGLAAGRCGYPGCREECIKFLTSDPTVIGEMAHLIAQSPDGPRGVPGGGNDAYENLILLCPTHHSQVDKAPPGTYPSSLLLDWKKDHEATVASAFRSPVFASRKDLALYLKPLLAENRAVWRTYGPESIAAQSDPISNLSEIWTLRKLGTIVPNNRKIIEAIRRNSSLFGGADYGTCCLFVEHAEGFESSCYERRQDVPRFPKNFQEVIDAYEV